MLFISYSKQIFPQLSATVLFAFLSESFHVLACRSDFYLELKLTCTFSLLFDTDLSEPRLKISAPFVFFPGQSLLCFADGFPTPEVSFGYTQWSYEKVRPGASRLAIPKKALAKNYSFECIAKNRFFEEKTRAWIRVRGKRMVTLQLRSFHGFWKR